MAVFAVILIVLALLVVLIAMIRNIRRYAADRARTRLAEAEKAAEALEEADAGETDGVSEGTEEAEEAEEAAAETESSQQESPAPKEAQPEEKKAEQTKAPVIVEETELPTYDKLCNLPIGNTFIDRCNDILENARRNNQIYAVLYLDIDRFKFINSIKGFSLGDFVLIRLAKELEQMFPEGSVVTRVSADQFAVLFPAIGSPPYLNEYYDQIIKACDKIKSDVGAKGAIRICAGVSVTDSASNPISYNMSSLMCKANIARYCHKIMKTDKFYTYDEAMISSAFYGVSTLEDYGENQYGDEFVIYYRSVRDIDANRLAGCDALVKWACQEDRDTGALMRDNARLPTNITKVFYQMCRSASRWRKAGKDIAPLYIHITELEFFKEDFDEFAAKCLSEFQLEPGLINIVVDASVVRISWATSAARIKRMRDMGMKVGIGGIDPKTQSLEFLGGLNANFIKLSAGFAKGITKNDSKLETLRYMLAMAASQNVRVVMEGVDTIEQMQTLHKLGVPLIIGRYNGMPYSPDEFMRMLDESVVTREQSDSTVIL